MANLLSNLSDMPLYDPHRFGHPRCKVVIAGRTYEGICSSHSMEHANIGYLMGIGGKTQDVLTFTMICEHGEAKAEPAPSRKSMLDETMDRFE